MQHSHSIVLILAPNWFSKSLQRRGSEHSAIYKKEWVIIIDPILQARGDVYCLTIGHLSATITVQLGLEMGPASQARTEQEAPVLTKINFCFPPHRKWPTAPLESWGWIKWDVDLERHSGPIRRCAGISHRRDLLEGHPSLQCPPFQQKTCCFGPRQLTLSQLSWSSRVPLRSWENQYSQKLFLKLVSYIFWPLLWSIAYYGPWSPPLPRLTTGFVAQPQAFLMFSRCQEWPGR